MERPLMYQPPQNYQNQNQNQNDGDRVFETISGACNNNGPATTCGFCCVVLFIILVSFFSIIPVNQMGILQNNLTGTILADTTYPAGIYLWGPLYSVLKFKTTAITVEYSDGAGADRLPVKTRTGADPQDPDSGGQPISISVAFQYRFVPQNLGRCFLDFGSTMAMHQRFIQLSFNQISNMAQDFVPQDFWLRRDTIALEMWKSANHTLWNNADNGAHIIQFEILRVDFAQQFEDTITQIQVAEQQKVVNEYKQQVQEVLQEIANLKATNEAQCKNITSNGEALASEIVAEAKKDGFHIKQQAKAQAYSQLRDAWGMSTSQMIRYFQIKSLQQQTGKVSVEIPNPAQNARYEMGMPHSEKYSRRLSSTGPTSRDDAPRMEREDNFN